MNAKQRHLIWLVDCPVLCPLQSDYRDSFFQSVSRVTITTRETVLSLSVTWWLCESLHAFHFSIPNLQIWRYLKFMTENIKHVMWKTPLEWLKWIAIENVILDSVHHQALAGEPGYPDPRLASWCLWLSASLAAWLGRSWEESPSVALPWLISFQRLLTG
jgi:hypothetical protein